MLTPVMCGYISISEQAMINSKNFFFAQILWSEEHEKENNQRVLTL